MSATILGLRVRRAGEVCRDGPSAASPGAFQIYFFIAVAFLFSRLENYFFITMAFLFSRVTFSVRHAHANVQNVKATAVPGAPDMP